MIVFPCVHYFMENLPFSHLENFENVLNWYQRMTSNEQIKEAAIKCGMFPKTIPTLPCLKPSITIPTINQDSLYKRDPSHSKMRIKYKNPTETLQLLEKFEIYPKYSETCCTQLDWNSLPKELHPATGDLPAKRVERKCQQIESIVTAALKIAVEGQTIVEFCAGGGHVGLLLAYFLPKCKIILIENKESSMQRAFLRAKVLNLKNIVYYQCNLDYFKRSFDMGISLHACGVATDLVIQQCLQQQASFVCCPCCYGGIQDTHLLQYPLSNTFRTTGLSYKNYTLLAHCADRNEVNTPTAKQGELCMGLIDTDRVHLAQEYEYEVRLTTLHPKSCSPKHNLIIGVSPKWKNAQ
ncbi:glutathione S-transferase C-terminal domain-containing protein [Parasteatoda tepidariorum]|uniref:glutathione S-transferase C-terminal domain-containing protein n=1 Tax=Parasteatoda tepidariorum TaxID=114398 RepID=UPI0039BCBB1D